MINHLESSSVIRINFSNKKSDQLKAGETARWLRATTALAQGPGLVSSFCTCPLTNPVTPASDLDPLLCTQRHACVYDSISNPNKLKTRKVWPTHLLVYITFTLSIVICITIF